MLKHQNPLALTSNNEAKVLGIEGMNAILDKGKKWAPELANTLNADGSAVFPHTFLSQCAHDVSGRD